MTAPTPSATPERAGLATVIPLVVADRPRPPHPAIDVAPTHAPPSVPAVSAELAHALDLIDRRAGARAAELPDALGRAVLRFEALLEMGPTRIDPGSTEPAAAIAAAVAVLKAATAVVELIAEEAEVLGEALSADLRTLPLVDLCEVAEAVLGLSMAPRTVSSWGTPAAAEAAEVVLHVAAEDLRAAARSHAQLYDRFTEEIWQVPGALLLAGRRRWRLVARARLRRGLRAASRTGRVPGALTAATKEVLAAREARARLTQLAPLVAHHLGDIDRGPLSDVDAALAGLGAVRRLQASLGDLLDGARLEQLLLADAFRSHDVASPAVNLRNAVRAWVCDVQLAGGGEDAAIAIGLDDLAQWTGECATLLPALTEGHAAVVRLGVPARTLRSLVEVLLVRARITDLLVAEQPQVAADETWGAS